MFQKKYYFLYLSEICTSENAKKTVHLWSVQFKMIKQFRTKHYDHIRSISRNLFFFCFFFILINIRSSNVLDLTSEQFTKINLISYYRWVSKISVV